MINRASHVVFISYSAKDQTAADAVCAALEQHDMRCWIAHRDNRPGESWDEGILDAIDGAKLLVIVLSAHANASPMIKREVVRATERNLAILPLRIEDVEPSRGLQFSLSGTHWLNAYAGPVESNLEALVAAARQLLRGEAQDMAERRGLDVFSYMVSRGPGAHRIFTGRPLLPWAQSLRGSEEVSRLREKLLVTTTTIPQPVPLTATGTLLPCAPLANGTWERQREGEIQRFNWRDGLQRWLFKVFDLWGPSWDYTWDFDHWNRSKMRPFFVAQLGYDDEVDSIPVVVAAAKARTLLENFITERGGFQASVRGVLAHRDHFVEKSADRPQERLGGLLDFCIWLDGDDPTHVITPLSQTTEFYSGYLWKCLGVSQSISRGTQELADAWFISEHANLADRDSVSYALDSLEAKQENISRKYGNVLLLAKSSWLVPGEPSLDAERFYGTLLTESASGHPATTVPRT